MNSAELVKRLRIRETLTSLSNSELDTRVDRFLEIDHHEILANHYFAPASSECLYLYRDGYFIAAAMMSHAINEGIIKFVSERNGIERYDKKNSRGLRGLLYRIIRFWKEGETKSIKTLIDELKAKNIVSEVLASASTKIWRSYRNDLHHMNPTVDGISFENVAKENLKSLAIIEKEIFGYHYNNGAMVLHQPKYWDINE